MGIFTLVYKADQFTRRTAALEIDWIKVKFSCRDHCWVFWFVCMSLAMFFFLISELGSRLRN